MRARGRVALTAGTKSDAVSILLSAEYTHVPAIPLPACPAHVYRFSWLDLFTCDFDVVMDVLRHGKGFVDVLKFNKMK